MQSSRPSSPWLLATVVDGIVRSVSTIFQNLTGQAVSTWHGALASNFVIECVRTLSGVSAMLLRKQSFRVSWRQFKLLCVWAFFATLMTCLHIISYEQGADQGIAVLALQTSIIWGVFFDWAHFANRPTPRQLIGVGLLLLATYAAVDFPGLLRREPLPWWIWFKLAIALMLGVNELTRRKLAAEVPSEERINPVLSSFYVGGLSLVFLSPFVLFSSQSLFSHQNITFWLSSAVLGWLVVTSTILSLIPYLSGSNILLRKFFGNATALVLAIISGAVIFHEPITFGKGLGFALVVAAFIFVDKERLLQKELLRCLPHQSTLKGSETKHG